MIIEVNEVTVRNEWDALVLAKLVGTVEREESSDDGVKKESDDTEVIWATVETEA